jgi:hypothetical protein
MARHLSFFVLVSALATTAPAAAQSLGTFRWQLAPFGSVLQLTVTQQGAVYILNGFEAQCGGNASLPVWGVAVPQANGSVFMGLTTITEGGRGLHTRATILLSDLGGSWQDNANSNGTLVFNPGPTCPGGPRVSPVVPDRANEAGPAAEDASAYALQALKDELAALGARLAVFEARKP